MAHVRASRELLPAWLERGRGCFVVTASAAGLLTMLGSATYSVTKHAAESYAEWLAATYEHRGLVVHCICPQGVRTNMLAQSGEAGKVVLQDAAIEPEQVAEALLEGMAAGRFLILPHPEVARVLPDAGQRPRPVAARDEPDAAADRGSRARVRHEGLAGARAGRAARRADAGRGPRPRTRPRPGAGAGARGRDELPRRAHVPRHLPGPPAAALHPGHRAVRRGAGGGPGRDRDRAGRPAHRRPGGRRLRRAGADERGQRAARPGRPGRRRGGRLLRHVPDRVVRAAPAGRAGGRGDPAGPGGRGRRRQRRGPAGQGGRRPGHRRGRRRARRPRWPAPSARTW